MAFSFGSSATQPPAFGATTKPSFSFGSGGFGTTTTTAAPAFGTATTSSFSGFGTNTSGFGTGTGSSLFGSTAPTFGTNQTSTGGGLFGSTAPAFGTAAPAFGSTAPAFGAAAPAFGSTAPTFGSGAPSFGATTTTTSSLNFGNTAPAFGSSFGSTFGKPAGTLGFGLGTFGQAQPQQPQPPQELNPYEIFNCAMFGDERDQILAKWNLLQAQWGHGTAYYNRNAQPVVLTENNQFCRFKAVGYSRLSSVPEHEGLVALTFNKLHNEIKNAEAQLITTIGNVLGNRPNLKANVHNITPLADDKTQVEIYILDTSTGGRIPATDVSNALSTDAAKNQLTHTSARPLSRPPQHVLQKYLETAPLGINPKLWKQAQACNPDPEKYVPVPVIGFSELKWRSKCQAEQAKLQADYLDKACSELAELQRSRAESLARRTALAARLHELRHLLLGYLARTLSSRPEPLSQQEDEARARLVALQQQLTAPPMYTGGLNELVSAVRLERSANVAASQERYKLDPAAGEELKSFLSQQQKGIQYLLKTATEDQETLETISDHLAELRT